MKKLELNQMEIVEGGLSCESSFGLTIGLLVGGFILTAATAGAGIALVAGAYANGFITGRGCTK